MKASRQSPIRLLVSSFLALIGVGAGLLLLPISTPASQPITVVDALFTATSAACVTGLVVRDTGSGFTLFGQLVILALIQLGGIGIMTFSLLVLGLLAGRMSIASRFFLTQSWTGTSFWGELRPLIRLVVRFTIATEVLGALFLFSHWHSAQGASRALYAALFHSVSAFCNAGFSLWSNSLMQFRDDIFVNGIIMVLITLGGLGYLVVYDVLEARMRKGRISLHSRLVLTVSAILVVSGAVLIWWLEADQSHTALSPASRLLASVFQSVTARTAGFNTVDIGALGPATLFLLILLMFIGGSPGSCAGGIKTTTLGVLVLTAWHRLRGHRHVNAFRRTVGPMTVGNALAVSLSGTAIVIVGLLMLLVLESPDRTVVDSHAVFIAYLFETVSALGTVGLSTGITAELSEASRLLVAVLMFVGRIGPLTVFAALLIEAPSSDWQMASEEIMVG